MNETEEVVVHSVLLNLEANNRDETPLLSADVMRLRLLPKCYILFYFTFLF